jgi:hypothetical protein
MPLSATDAEKVTLDLLELRAAEKERLDVLHAYWRGTQPLPAVIPSSVPNEVRHMAEMARINVCRLVVKVPAQSLFVAGYRVNGTSEDGEAWRAWRANRKNATQAALWRAAFAYGTAYDLVLPGDPLPKIRSLSPRNLTVAYGDDEEWPAYALEVIEPRTGGRRFRLYDETSVYELVETKDENTGKAVPRMSNAPDAVATHDAGVCPVVRYRNVVDLDGEHTSELDDIIPLQDQLDFTTFDMLVAQHYAAFRQRYIIGWTSTDESEKAKAAASRLWTFQGTEDNPESVRVGEFAQTDLSGYLESREATMQHLGVIGQVPPHNLLGQMVNLSAEALVAAESSARRKIEELETSFGESTEQMLGLVGQLMGEPVPDEVEVRWKDTEARSFAATVDALGKLGEMLGVPKQALWERIPDVTEEELGRWRAALESGGDVIDRLLADIDRQARPTTTPADPTTV